MTETNNFQKHSSKKAWPSILRQVGFLVASVMAMLAVMAILAVGLEQVTIPDGIRGSLLIKSKQQQPSAKAEMCPHNPNPPIPHNATLDRNDVIFHRKGWDSAPYILERHKLLFFTVPKNSCTEWKRLLRRMTGIKDWKSYGVRTVHDPTRNGIKRLDQISEEEQYEIMTSPNWTRAIFVRDPLERLLSAFIDKGIRTWHIEEGCCRGYQLKQNNTLRQQQCQLLKSLKQNHTHPTMEQFTFETFVEGFASQCDDPHWAPQSQKLKPSNWQFINFVGQFHSLEHDARCLLEKVGAWEEYGSNGWGEHGNLSLFQRNTATHRTSARDKMAEFFTPQVLQKAAAYVNPDFEFPLFHFQKPVGLA